MTATPDALEPCLPRTRGWSRLSGVPLELLDVLPVPAGMVPAAGVPARPD